MSLDLRTSLNLLQFSSSRVYVLQCFSSSDSLSLALLSIFPSKKTKKIRLGEPTLSPITKPQRIAPQPEHHLRTTLHFLSVPFTVDVALVPVSALTLEELRYLHHAGGRTETFGPTLFKDTL